MIITVITGTVVGIKGVPISVEVDVANRGFPTFSIVGLPSKAVEEAKDRVRSALVNSGYDVPDSRITVNLAPADLPKAGSGFDLPIAVGLLSASGIINPSLITDSLFIGELSLRGEIKQVPGIIPILKEARNTIESAFVPYYSSDEAIAAIGKKAIPVQNLPELVAILKGQQKPVQPAASSPDKAALSSAPDFQDIHGQQVVKRALEIAAAGFHNIHLCGPPGSGKTALSRSFPGILPPLSDDEWVDVAAIYSAAGLWERIAGLRERPYRSPHHTISRNGLIGGGSVPKPGEITLSHRGVLFLDELPEFPRGLLEALRQPVEDGHVDITRVNAAVRFPARFQLLAASNPCPCGYLGHPTRECTCTAQGILSYQKRISGPLLDRIDLHVQVQPVREQDLLRPATEEASKHVRQRVLDARERQRIRYRQTPITTNAELSSALMREYIQIPPEAEEFLKNAIEKLSLSARSFYRILKVGRTIADLDCSDKIKKEHIAESIQYRSLSA